MEITEVRIKLMEESGERLQAFCSITFDDSFVIRDLKIIDGAHGPFVAMPSRKLTAHCPGCRMKNHLRAAYCNQCGAKLKEERLIKDEDGRAKLYADIAHPINSACREMIQQRVIHEFEVELERAKQPGYVSRYDDYEPEDAGYEPAPVAAERQAERPRHDRPEHVRLYSGGERTHIEPAEREPRGPHHVAARRAAAASAPPPPSRAPREGFGAGIFEEPARRGN